MKNNSREPAQTAGNAPDMPDKIYIQCFGVDEEDLTPDDLKEVADKSEMTWCWHRLFDTDVEYERVAASSQEATPCCAMCGSNMTKEELGWYCNSCQPRRYAPKMVAEPAPSPATTRQWATFYRCGKNMGNDLLVIPCDLEKDHDGPCERNVWPVKPNATPKWERQESCPECDGDGCNLCKAEEQTIAYWKTRAETAELKVLTFNEEIAKLRTDAPSPATKETPHTTTEDWVPCPVCGESGMSRETDIEGNVIISCVNHACASNGGSNTSGLSLQRELDSAHRLWEKEHDELVILREKVRRYDAGFDAGAKSVVAAPQLEISQWIDTELWNFAHGLALDIGVSQDAAGDKSKEELIHRSMAAVIGICLRMAGAAALPSAQKE